jgi:hypothetical protein
MGQAAKAREKLVLWSRSDEHAHKGAVLDIDTGVLRRDHVLVLRSPQVEVMLGLGGTAGALMDFAHKGETCDDPLLDTCSEADRAIARGDLARSRALGVPDVIATIEDRALRRLALVEYVLGKASADDPVHPGYPKGDPEGRGGQFRPKDTTGEDKQSDAKESEAQESTEAKLKRLKALREFRAAAQTALVLIRTAPLEGVPVVDVGVSIEALVELGRIAIELGNDEDEINKAIDFVKHGPYTLDQLRVDQNDKEFSSFNAFKKTSLAELLQKEYGSAGDGKEYHHIVEQGGANEDNFTAEELHSTKNIVPLPDPIHDLVSAEYSKEYEKTGITVRQWLQTQPFDKQYEYGLDVLTKLGILK